MSLGSPGQPFFWDNWGDLRFVIEELGNSGPLDPFRLTDMFLKRAVRQKSPLFSQASRFSVMRIRRR